MTDEKPTTATPPMAQEQGRAEPREPGRARALFSTADFRLLRRALETQARATDDRDELARINALHHRLGTYVPSDG